ncbi:MAG TPA: hypothetical protein VF132_05345 [Rudaea sp.]
MTEPKLRKCAHERCLCQVQDGQTYCGPHCATAGVQTQPAADSAHCGCGHPACASSESHGPAASTVR